MAVNLSDCSFERVVVYSDRSECKRVVHFDVKSGENDILIYGLPHFIESESIRVEGKSVYQNKNKSCQPIINDVIYFSSFDISKNIDNYWKSGRESLTAIMATHSRRIGKRGYLARLGFRKGGTLILVVQFVYNLPGEEVQQLQQCEEVFRPGCIVHNLDDDYVHAMAKQCT
ncbi:hypothetical protein LOD99_5244 [Oopsacas minuta]|uniref:DUF4140 domain-containing protein n=1 Tax=Oopsacas minuta TaxID=111878 RepID=A0AAV7JR39_9METZ|nr:hypothetical protein LOD99_5244 [Oopsacas minuta]